MQKIYQVKNQEWELPIFFVHQEDGEVYARYLTNREEIQYHPRINMLYPNTYWVDDGELFLSATEAIAAYEEQHGPIISGEERYKAYEEKQIREGKLFKMAMIPEEDLPAYQEWKASQIKDNEE